MESETTTTRTKPSGERPEKPTEMEGEMPEMPEDFDGEMPEMPSGEMGEMPGMPGGDGEMMAVQETTSSDSVLHPVGYLALGAGSVILSMIVIYACFSNFFHKKPGETFSSKKNFILYIVASVILAAGLIALCYFIPTWVA